MRAQRGRETVTIGIGCSEARPPRGLALPAVDEALRYEPISPFTARIVISEIEYRGVGFPAGSIVLVSAWHANREDAEPARSTSPSTVAHGSSRSAPGSKTAWARTWRAEIQEALGVLAERVRSITIDGEPEFGTPSGIYGWEKPAGQARAMTSAATSGRLRDPRGR